MVVSYLCLDMALPGAKSLKEKRAVLRSIQDKARRDFRVSIAEVDDQDLWGNASLGACVASNDPILGEAVMRRVCESIEGRPEVEVRSALIDSMRVP